MSSTVHWQPDGVPASLRYGDIYRSAAGGLAQAQHVFLHGCGLLADEGTPTAWAGQQVWQILETGFGLGLNFLATWHAWLNNPQRPARLFYSAVEAHPPEAADLLRSAASFPELAPLAEQLAAQWRGLLPGIHRIELAGGALQLTLAVDDARSALAELTGCFDSVFLDGFSPEKNPAMWSNEVLRAVARLCRPGARAATWCVAGEIRQRLADCGFETERVPGLAPKRQALIARYMPVHASSQIRPPAPGRCVIVGAGLAAAGLAYSLAVRGWQVTVLGQDSEPADGASALIAGVFAPHISPDDRPLSRLSRAGCAATLTRVRALLRENIDFAASGVLECHAPGQRRCPADWQNAETAAASALSSPAGAELRAQTGLPVDDDHPALWHANAGWVRPSALVRAMLAAPGIRFIGDARAERIAPHGGGWQVLDQAGRTLAEADLVALAAGFGTRALLDASFVNPANAVWRLHALRGQIAFGSASQLEAQSLPPFPVNGHGNFVMLREPEPIWVTGSTFVRENTRSYTRAAEHVANRHRLAELLPRAAAMLAPQWQDGRAKAWAGVRCTVPDRLPMLGPLVWPAATANAPHAPWVLTGLGSRGLTLAVLAGEIAAAWLHNEPLPIERSLAHALRARRWSEKNAARKKLAHLPEQ
ncbi:MAG: FAD-dependent 5-carboxymethylaminomethyl-2-thiouridine(34) oxidoreductase MnmC [Burkholderiaceae bacterium]|jgi:tRNA 5-methylaminomethyl-2-thiouridine biosynthesis bifunctional protein|nr:FAD-dependent 5-carboxymethylaminomethyl-2-thiouridine(34) oxidoreductase MnmC [Burkholderiaceae bacterium]